MSFNQRDLDARCPAFLVVLVYQSGYNIYSNGYNLQESLQARRMSINMVEDRTVLEEQEINLGFFAPYLLHKLNRHFQAVLSKSLKDYRLTVAEWRTLVAVHRFGVLTIDDIVRTIDLPQSTVSRTVQKLQDRRLLKKTWNDKDGRIAEVRISKSGDKRRAHATAAAVVACNAEVERIAGEDAAHWIATMRNILTRLGGEQFLDLNI